MNNVKLVLGTMTFGESVFNPEVKKFIKAYMDEGYNEFDTAYVYNNGECERLLGEVLKEIVKPYKIATKINPRITGRLDDVAAYKQLNESLERLKLESVDILYLHFPDPATPVELVLQACDDLHKQGKFKELGLSNFPAWMVADVWNICEKHNWIKPTVYQGIYNPLTRKAENELNDCLKHFKIRFYAFNPMAGGLLTGRYSRYEDTPTDGRFTHRPNYQARYWKESYFKAVEVIKKTAEKYGITSIEATYRWLAYNSMLDGNRGDAILIGASKIEHMLQNMNALRQGPLPEEVVKAFETAWTITRGDSPEYFTLYKGKGSIGGEINVRSKKGI